MDMLNNNRPNVPEPGNPDPRIPEAHLEALLDQALRPEAAPAGLSDRIVARTVGLLRRSHLGVLARLDELYRWPRAVAAAVVVAAAMGIALSAAQIVRSAHTLVTVDRGLAALPVYNPTPDAGPESGPPLALDTAMRQYHNALRDAQADLERGLSNIEQQGEDNGHG
jgi:hypothetical protein